MIKFSRFLILSTLFIASCSTGVDEKDCKRFKTGTFYYEGNSGIRVIRSENIQVEYGGYDDITYSDTYSIVWEDDCHYQLSLLGTDRPEDLDFYFGDTLYTEITSASRGYYSFKAVKNGEVFEGMLRVSR